MALKHARLKVFTAVLLNSQMFGSVMPCRFISCYHCLKDPVIFKSIRKYSPFDTA